MLNTLAFIPLNFGQLFCLVSAVGGLVSLALWFLVVRDCGSSDERIARSAAEMTRSLGIWAGGLFTCATLLFVGQSPWFDPFARNVSAVLAKHVSELITMGVLAVVSFWYCRGWLTRHMTGPVK